MRLTFMIVPALLLAATCTAMASPPPDTTQPEKPKLNLQFEVRPGLYNGEFTVSLQASYQWFNFFSTDLFGRTFPVSIHGGVTLRPVEFIFLQGSAGYGNFTDQAPDGPGTQPIDAPLFDADIVYGLRGGVQIPFTKRLVVLMSFGTVWLTDYSYCYNCGFITDPLWTPKYRIETHEDELLELGIGIRM